MRSLARYYTLKETKVYTRKCGQGSVTNTEYVFKKNYILIYC